MINQPSRLSISDELTITTFTLLWRGWPESYRRRVQLALIPTALEACELHKQQYACDEVPIEIVDALIATQAQLQYLDLETVFQRYKMGRPQGKHLSLSRMAICEALEQSFAETKKTENSTLAYALAFFRVMSHDAAYREMLFAKGSSEPEAEEEL